MFSKRCLISFGAKYVYSLNLIKCIFWVALIVNTSGNVAQILMFFVWCTINFAIEKYLACYIYVYISHITFLWLLELSQLENV